MSETARLEDQKNKGTEDRRAGADSGAERGCVRGPGRRARGGEAPSGWGRVCKPLPAPGPRLRHGAQAAAGGW